MCTLAALNSVLQYVSSTGRKFSYFSTPSNPIIRTRASNTRSPKLSPFSSIIANSALNVSARNCGKGRGEREGGEGAVRVRGLINYLDDLVSRDFGNILDY